MNGVRPQQQRGTKCTLEVLRRGKKMLFSGESVAVAAQVRLLKQDSGCRVEAMEPFLPEMAMLSQVVMAAHISQTSSTIQLHPNPDGAMQHTLKNNRAHAEDYLPADIYKYVANVVAPYLEQTSERVWETTGWRAPILLPFFKKGDNKNCSNSPIDVAIKTFRAKSYFPLGRGCIDQIFHLRRVQEKRWSNQQPTTVCFIDIVMEFDSVDRGPLRGQ